MRLLRFRALLPLLSLPALWLAGCGGFHGVVTPTLSSINPATIEAGSAGFTLTASGSNFTSGTRIVWDGIPLATKVESNSKLSADVTAVQIINPGNISVSVLKSDTTSSNVLTLKITGLGPQGPKLTSISPSSVASGSADFTLTATGTSFVSGSVITLNGVGITTTFDSVTQLHATVPASKVAVAGTINVGVLDTGNKLSNELPLTVTGTIPSAPPTLTSLNPGVGHHRKSCNHAHSYRNQLCQRKQDFVERARADDHLRLSHFLAGHHPGRISSNSDDRQCCCAES